MGNGIKHKTDPAVLGDPKADEPTRLQKNEILAALQEERAQREQACLTEIHQALQAYDCQIVGQPYFDGDGRVRVQVSVKSNG